MERYRKQRKATERKSRESNFYLQLLSVAFSGFQLPAVALLLPLFLSSCAGPESYLVSPALQAEAGGRIALLPFDNYSNDVSAPGLLREAIFKRFTKRGYSPMDTDETDEKLRNMGVTDGGQLAAVKPADIGAALGVDMLCYGTLEEFTFQNLGFVMRKLVRLRLRIVSAATGEALFEAAGKGRDTKVFLDKEEAKAAFIMYSAQKLLDNMLKHPLRAESDKALDQLFNRLPQR